MRLQPVAFGAACGATLAIIGFLGTLFSLLWGSGHTITQLSAIYPGYSWSVPGAFVALLWGAVYGFAVGGLLAVVYNRIASRGASL